MTKPSCTRHYPNPWLDRESQKIAASNLPNSNSLSNHLQAAHSLFDKCREYALTKVSSKDHIDDIGTLYSGEVLGFAYLSYILALHPTSPIGQTNELLQTALEITSRSISYSQSHGRKRRMRVSLLEGREIGALALSCAIHQALGNYHTIPLYSNEILNFGRFETASSLIGDLQQSECEVLYGRCGYLHAILFIRNVVLKDKNFGSTVVQPILETILRNGKMIANQYENPGGLKLMWEWHGKVYLGAAHGIVGILHTLLSFIPDISHFKDENGDEYVSMIKDTITALNDSFCFPSGNLASSLYSKNDTLVQWCHGATGHVLLLIKAFEVWGDEEYLHLAESIANDVIWPRGLLTKGVGLCHGISGNAFVFLALHRAVCSLEGSQYSKDATTQRASRQTRQTQSKETSFAANMRGYRHDDEDRNVWKERSRLFSAFALQHLDELELVPDRPYSLYEGLGGLCLLLLNQCCDDEEFSSRFPLFDL